MSGILCETCEFAQNGQRPSVEVCNACVANWRKENEAKLPTLGNDSVIPLEGVIPFSQLKNLRKSERQGVTRIIR